METTNMQPLSNKNSDIHLWRMRLAVLWCIVFQFILLFVFILFFNIDPFHPLSWLANSFKVFTFLHMWFKLILLIIIIYIQGEVCKKDYVTGSVYYTTRLQKICHVFSVRNLLLLMLHIVIGITVFWIYSSVTGQAFQSLTRRCQGNILNNYSEYCLEERKFFLLFGGLWIGVYYFGSDYMFGSRSLSFPLIQQYKFYRIKSALKENVKHSVKCSFLPTVIFLIIYYFYGSFLRSIFLEVLSCQLDTDPIDSVRGLLNIQLIFSLFLFSTVFIIAMKMMELLFNVHLTEHNIFPISTTMLSPGNYISLVDSLKTTNVPIVYHLGYLDLFILSTKSRSRRGELFILSHPGGHPHSWNGIFRECVHLIKTFTEDLNQAMQQITNRGKEVPQPLLEPEITAFHFHSHKIRKLSSPVSKKDIMPSSAIGLPRPSTRENETFIEIALANIQIWLNIKLDQLYRKPYIAYFFAESPDSRINYLLCQSQPLIWAVQSLAFLAAASLTEDHYGIIQRDLPEIIVTIVNLKQILDKLFKQNLIIKKSFANDPLDVQMKYLLRTSVKRSLYKIAVTFGPYVRDLGLPLDVELQMNNFIAFKEVM